MKARVHIWFFAASLLLATQAYSQNSSVAIGTNTPDPDAVLLLVGNGSQGLLIPKVASTNALAKKVGMVAYNTTDNKVYYFDGTNWVAVGGGTGGGSTYTLSLSGNEILLTDGVGTITKALIATGTAPSANQLLMWNGTNWEASTFSDATHASGVFSVTGIKGKTVPALPSSTQALVYDGTAWKFQALTGSGTVTNVSGTLPISVATSTTTPVISIAQANGTTNGYLSSADFTTFNTKLGSGSTVGGDLSGTLPNPTVARLQGVNVLSTAPTLNQVLQYNGSAWAPAPLGAGGTVTSVGLSMPPIFTVTGSPVTTSGTLATTLATQTAATVFAAPTASTGAPTFRALAPTDIPTLNQNTTGTAASITGTITESQVTNLTTDLANKVTANGAITAGTNAKITYDAKGLVTSGAALAVSDLPIMTPTTGGAVPSPPNDATKFLNGAGTFSTPAGGGTVTTVSVTTANGVSGTVATPTSTPAITLTLGAITPTSVAASGTVTGSNISGTNTGDNAVNSLYSGLVTNATHTGDATGSTALTVVRINGVSMAGLPTGILKNTTGTGVPSIATGPDLPAMTATAGGAVPLPPNDATKFLNGTGTFSIPPAGMTNPLTTTGDIIYGVGSTPTRLAGATGVLKSTGAAAPTWGTITGTDLATNINIATTGNITTNAPGNLAIAGTSTLSGAATLTSLAGAGTRMVVANPTGVLSTAAIPVGFSTSNVVPRGDGVGLVASAIQDDGTTTGIGAAPVAASKLTVTNSTAGTLQAIKATNNQVGAGSSTAVWGDASGSTNTNFGVFGTASGGGLGATGVQGTGSNSVTSTGVQGIVNGTGVTTGFGVRGASTSTSATINYGVYGDASGGTTNWAGYFKGGNVAIENGLAVGGTPSFGLAGEVLTSAGPGVAPTWTSAGAGFSTLNTIPKGNGTTLVASQLLDDGTNVGVGVPTPLQKLDVNGSVNITTGSGIFVNNVRVFHTTGTNNLFSGVNAGQSNTGSFNAFFGPSAGSANTSGASNTFVGYNAGVVNSSGVDNTFIGRGTGNSNTTGARNTFVGRSAGLGNSAGNSNTFVGKDAGLNNTASFNVFLGDDAGTLNNSGASNLFAGRSAGAANTTGGSNTFLGVSSGAANATGSNNTLVGQGSNVGADGLTNATAIGSGAIVSISNALVLGNNVDVGIGTSSPRSVLELQSGNLILSGNSTTPLDPVDIDFKTLSDAFIAKIWTSPTTNTFWISTSTTPTANKDFTIDPAGNIGIDNPTPTEKLDVTGNIRFSGALMPNNTAGTAGMVLTSAGPGTVPTWSTVSGGTVLISNPGTLNLFAGVGAGASVTGSNNSIFGAGAGAAASSAINNSYFGAGAGAANLTGAENTYIGRLAGSSHTTGSFNVYVGKDAGLNRTTGGLNTFIGFSAGGISATSISGSTFVGSNAGENTTANFNTFIGELAGQANTGGTNNTYVGHLTGSTNNSGSQITLIGKSADVGANGLSNATAVGFGANVSASNKVRIGNNAVTVIEGQVAFTAASDRRMKMDITNLNEGLDFIQKLKPVSYRMINGDNRMNWGFIAQEVEALVGTENAVLTIGGDSARSLGLRYTDFVAPLTKAVQELAQQNEKQAASITALQAQVQARDKKIADLEVSLQNANSAVADIKTLQEELEKIKAALGLEANSKKK